jgi:hypothetical protein
MSLREDEIEHERALCESIADLYPKNYYAWNHRLWLLAFMSMQQLEAELEMTAQWLRSHVSGMMCGNFAVWS